MLSCTVTTWNTHAYTASQPEDTYSVRLWATGFHTFGGKNQYTLVSTNSSACLEPPVTAYVSTHETGYVGWLLGLELTESLPVGHW